MKMITKEIETWLEKHPIYSQDGRMGDATVGVYYFDPMSAWTWYVTEGERMEDGDWEFFGLVQGFEWEWGYFRLSELTQTIPGRLPIEREINTEPGRHTVRELAAGCPEPLLKPCTETDHGLLSTEQIIGMLAENGVRADHVVGGVQGWTADGAGQQTLF